MHVSDEISWHIVDHDTFVESVELEEAILPPLGFAADVVGVEATEFEDRGGILC